MTHAKLLYWCPNLKYGNKYHGFPLNFILVQFLYKIKEKHAAKKHEQASLGIEKIHLNIIQE